MKYSMIGYILGQVLKFEGLFMLLPFITGMIYREQAAYAYLGIGLLCACLGFLLTIRKPKNSQIFTKEGFATVALSWIVLSILGALPFVVSGDIPSYIDALFETISGFTTTGASILPDVEALSHASLMWRSFTHWVGGMGVLVFIMSFLSITGGSTINLMKAESPGPSVSRLVPHVKDTAKILYKIYIFITVTEIILLCAFGMPLFDSLTLSFGTVGTGGFGILNSSIADYSPALQIIITVFMILSGVNYVAYFYLTTRQIKEIFHVEEIRVYFGVILASSIFIAFNIRSLYPTLGECFRHAFFQVGSIITTTGYATTDFDLWPETSKTILVTLMIIGACAGSTGGGLKISRLLILCKSIPKQLSLVIHPREIKVIKMDGKAIEHQVMRATNVYLAIYFFIILGSTLFVSVDNFDFTTNFTAVASALNNIGPGLAGVGPTRNFGAFSVFSKFVLMFDMLAGRLELYPLLILFMPSLWRRK